jgi:hypothetical protein
MNTHEHSSDDFCVISFASAILTEKNVPKGMAFRFVTDSRKEFVFHVRSNLLVSHMDFLLSFKNKRIDSLTDDTIEQYTKHIKLGSVVFNEHIPKILATDFDFYNSRTVAEFAYDEWADGVKIVATCIDKSSRSFFLSDFQIYKTIEHAERFIAMFSAPMGGGRNIIQ